VYISYKFGGLLSSTSAVSAAQQCTVGIDQHSSCHLRSFGGGTFVFRYYLLGATLIAEWAIRWTLPRISSFSAFVLWA